jgi:hypothetical protein
MFLSEVSIQSSVLLALFVLGIEVPTKLFLRGKE